MLSYFRFTSTCLRTCTGPYSHVSRGRFFSLTHSTWSETGPTPVDENTEEVEVEEERPEEEQVRQPQSYNEFMKTTGKRFKLADAPNKWLGNEVPFPMNPSFKPPVPVSDLFREKIYRDFMTNPLLNNVHALSQHYGLSLKRIDAILRLKGMEYDWKKGKKLQIGFQSGMETLLGVQDPHIVDRTEIYKMTQPRSDTQTVDILEEGENRDASRQRYQQLYWESVPEDGREPVLPASLEHAKKTATDISRSREIFKSNPKLMPPVKDDTTQIPAKKVQVITKSGRPSIKFADVGGHFIEVDQRLHRIARSERRAAKRAKKAEAKKALTLERMTAKH